MRHRSRSGYSPPDGTPLGGGKRTGHLGPMKHEPKTPSPTFQIRYTTDPGPPASDCAGGQLGPAHRLVESIRSFEREHSMGRVWWYRAPLLPLLAGGWVLWLMATTRPDRLDDRLESAHS